MSETVKSLHTKLSELYAVVTHIDQQGRAPAALGGFKFTQASDIAAAIRKALAERHLTMLPEVMERGETQILTTRNGATLLLEHMHITWRVTDGDTGESAVIESWGSGSDVGDKAIPKAITNAMKYALLAGFMVPQGDDPENEDQVTAGGGLDTDAMDLRGDAARIFAGDQVASPPAASGAASAPQRAGRGPSGGQPRCEQCGEPYKGKAGDYWHRASDGTIHRPAGQRRQA